MHWIIATTAAGDSKLHEHARKLTEQRKPRGLCPVTMFGWGDIETLKDKMVTTYPTTRN